LLRHQFYLGRRIIAAPPLFISAGASSPRRHYLSRPAHYCRATIISAGASHCRATIISAGASNRRATIANLGRHIPSPISSGASIAAPSLPILAGASHRLFLPAHPIAALPYRILTSASHCLAALSYLGRHIPSRAANPILAGASHRQATISYLGLHVHSMLRRSFLIQHAPYLPMNQSAWGGGGGQSFSAGG
jgi:hypothetical protein